MTTTRKNTRANTTVKMNKEDSFNKSNEEIETYQIGKSTIANDYKNAGAIKDIIVKSKEKPLDESELFSSLEALLNGLSSD